MNELYWQMITPGMRKVMGTFAMSKIGQRFYLAGGTGLGLQLGHRRSGDLEYFAPTEDLPSLEETLLRSVESTTSLLVDTGWGNLVFLVGGVRVSFYSYSYDLIHPLVEVEGIRIASVTDIALMKLEALLGRAEKKDFHDLYAICQRRPLEELLSLASYKYPEVRDFEAQVVKRLVYFDLAEQDLPPVMLEQVEWDTVKEFFLQQAAAIGREWIG
jgi:hypothetical protein